MNIPHRLMTRKLPLTVGITASKDPTKDPDIARGLGDAMNFVQAGGHMVQIVVLDGTKDSVPKIMEIANAFMAIADPEKTLGIEITKPRYEGNVAMFTIKSAKNIQNGSAREDE